MKPWITSHIPKSSSEIIGREAEVMAIKRFVSKFPAVPRKAILLQGPAGSGKTSIVSAIADELDFELFEINASDVRNKDQLQQKLLPAVRSKSFFNAGKIVLVDEMDGLSGTKDRGGIPELVRIIEQSAVPIILTANLIDPKKFKPILKVAQTLDMLPLPVKVVQAILTGVCVKEGVTVDEKLLRTLASQSDGDVRAAINDLQLVCIDGKIDESRFDLLSGRKRTQDIEHALASVFKGTDIAMAKDAMMQINEDIDQQFLWIDHNLPFEYTKPVDLARAYGALTKADVYRARIRKNQEWRFLLYVSTLLTAGVCCAKDTPYKSPANYVQTTRLLKIWQMNMSNAKRNSIAQKLAAVTHTSTKRAITQIDYYRFLFRKGGAVCSDISAELRLDDSEVAWLAKA